MKQVDELVTGERLRELSKDHATFTNSLGDDIFEVTYYQKDGELQDEAAGMEEQLMYKHEAVEFLKTADDLGIRVLSAVRSTWRFGDDGRPIYRVRWTVLNPGHEVNPEELNTGPDTTENINEVYESHFMSYKSLEDFISAHPGIQVIDRIEAGNLVKITYKIPTEMESEDKKSVLDDSRTHRRVTEKEQDPESERINKAMARMIYRKVRDLDISAEPGAGDVPGEENVRDSGDVMFGVDQKTLEEVVDESRKRGCAFTGTPESDEKIRKAMSGWSKERNTDFPGAKQAEEALRDLQEKWKSMNRPVLGPDPVITPGAETIDDIMEAERQNLERGRLTPKRGTHTISKEQLRESMEKTKEASHILSIKGPLPFPGEVDADKETEECNKNVSHPEDYYQYGRILERMDDTHRRKNSDYGDAAYKGYKKYGDYYFLTQLHNKFTRLENLTINNTKPQVEDESIDDTLLDMANYAVMYLESRHRND